MILNQLDIMENMMMRKSLLILCIIGISSVFSVHGMKRTKKSDALSQERYEDGGKVNEMMQLSTLEEIEEELNIKRNELLATSVPWLNPGKSYKKSDPVVWRTIGDIAREKDPIPNQIRTHAAHYKNCARWAFLRNMVLHNKNLTKELRKNFKNEEELIVPITLTVHDYLLCLSYLGMYHRKECSNDILDGIVTIINNQYTKQHTLDCSEDEIKNIENSAQMKMKIYSQKKQWPGRLKVAASLLASGVATAAGIKLLMNKDTVSKSLGVAAIVGGSWHCWEILQQTFKINKNNTISDSVDS